MNPEIVTRDLLVVLKEENDMLRGELRRLIHFDVGDDGGDVTVEAVVRRQDDGTIHILSMKVKP